MCSGQLSRRRVRLLEQLGSTWQPLSRHSRDTSPQGTFLSKGRAAHCTPTYSTSAPHHSGFSHTFDGARSEQRHRSRSVVLMSGAQGAQPKGAFTATTYTLAPPATGGSAQEQRQAPRSSVPARTRAGCPSGSWRTRSRTLQARAGRCSAPSRRTASPTSALPLTGTGGG